MRINLDFVLNTTGGHVVIKQNGSSFDSFHIDSRKAGPGSLFFAMKGTQTDGHLYVRDAASRGAAGVVVERMIEDAAITQIQVKDTLQALYDLGARVRSDSRSKFVGITGSSGKTSTKEFTAAMLARRYSVFRSEGNLNSTTGLPLSLLSMEAAECAVFEVGMNQPGEIATLSRLLSPHLGVILNVNPVHLGQFPSLEAIADEKASFAVGVPFDGIVVFNRDDLSLLARLEDTRQSRLTYGFSEEADLSIIRYKSKGVRGTEAAFAWKAKHLPFQTKLCGRGHIYNLAAASVVALSLGLPWNEIQETIESLEPYKQRGVLVDAGGITFYDDSYNSNPKALQIALETVGNTQGYQRKVAILGDMLELGPEENEFHRQAGEQVFRYGFDLLITTGPLSKFMAEGARGQGAVEVHSTENSSEAAELASGVLRPGDLVLLKGSRGMKMETVLERFLSVTNRG